MKRQEISAHCLKWTKKCKEAFTSLILAVIILHLCKYSSSIPASHADPLFLWSPSICGANTNMHVARSFSLVAAPDLLPKTEKYALLVLFFIALSWMNSPLWTMCAVSATHDRLSILFREARWELQPPSPRLKLRKYRQPGHGNSVTSYWAPKSVGNPMVQYYSL